MSGPIKPKDVAARKNESIPEEVFEVFNALIVENWNGHSANFQQSEATSRIVARLQISRSEAYKRGFLDVEDSYRKAGWKVEYDKPGYNETYEANFTFTKK